MTMQLRVSPNISLTTSDHDTEKGQQKMKKDAQEFDADNACGDMANTCLSSPETTADCSTIELELSEDDSKSETNEECASLELSESDDLKCDEDVISTPSIPKEDSCPDTPSPTPASNEEDVEEEKDDNSAPAEDVSDDEEEEENDEEKEEDEKDDNSAPLGCQKDDDTTSVSSIPRLLNSTHSLPVDFSTRKKSSIKSQKLRRCASLSFGTIEIREYDITLGDNPSCSIGPPVQIGWEYTTIGSIDVEQFENTRDQRRNMRQMLMNYYHRRNILMASGGYTEEELNKAEKEMNKIKAKRALTRAFLPMWKIEDAAESAQRKLKRVVKKKIKKKELITNHPQRYSI